MSHTRLRQRRFDGARVSIRQIWCPLARPVVRRVHTVSGTRGERRDKVRLAATPPAATRPRSEQSYPGGSGAAAVVPGLACVWVDTLSVMTAYFPFPAFLSNTFVPGRMREDRWSASNGEALPRGCDAPRYPTSSSRRPSVRQTVRIDESPGEFMMTPGGASRAERWSGQSFGVGASTPKSG